MCSKISKSAEICNTNVATLVYLSLTPRDNERPVEAQSCVRLAAVRVQLAYTTLVVDAACV